MLNSREMVNYYYTRRRYGGPLSSSLKLDYFWFQRDVTSAAISSHHISIRVFHNPTGVPAKLTTAASIPLRDILQQNIINVKHDNDCSYSFTHSGIDTCAYPFLPALDPDGGRFSDHLRGYYRLPDVRCRSACQGDQRGAQIPAIRPVVQHQ